jgi:hypothetical protein
VRQIPVAAREETLFAAADFFDFFFTGTYLWLFFWEQVALQCPPLSHIN